MKQTIFITGIDTDSGKSYATGLLAAWLLKQGHKVITQKPVQTGCVEFSEDILLHRKLMGIPLQEVDKEGLTAPYIFPIPASPHLAARLAGKEISLEKIDSATRELLKIYDIILIEGAGGLLSPISENVSTAEFIVQRNYPVVLVTSAKIGSINHTLLTIEALKKRNIRLLGTIYNQYPVQNQEIYQDTLNIFVNQLADSGYAPAIVEIPQITDTATDEQLNSINFSLITDFI